MKTFLSVAGVCCLLLSVPSQVDGQDHIRARLGISTVSGVLGLEYQKDNFALDLGFLPPVDTGLLDEDKPRIAIGARYLMAPEANGLFGALSFIMNSEAVGETTGVEHYNALFVTAGYRLLFADRFDLTLGGGYGPTLGLSKEAEQGGVDSGTPSIDITLGYAIK